MLFKSLTGREALNELFLNTKVLIRSQDEYGNGVIDGLISKASAMAGGAPGSELPA